MSTCRYERVEAKPFVDAGLQVLESSKTIGVGLRALSIQGVELFLECPGHVWVGS